MNIMVINSSKEWGGTEKWALNTAQGLSGAGHKVYFGCRGDLFQGRASKQNVEFLVFPFTNNIDLITIFMLRSFFTKNKIDVVMPSKQREYFLAGLAAKMGTSTKVAGIYGMDRPIHNLRNLIVFCKLFDIVIVNARKLIGILGTTKSFDIEKCKVVYMGVEPVACIQSTRDKIRESLGVAKDEICLMGIGRLAPQKGFDYALKAFSLLVKKYDKIKLVIIGDGDLEIYRNLAFELGVVDKVVFAGFRNDIHQVEQAMDILWLTSRSEGMPNTLLEAMSAKKPVVSFDIAGISEIIVNNENSFLIPFEDIGMLVSRTSELIDSPQLRSSMGENAYKTIVDKFSFIRMIKDTEKYLLELVNDSQDERNSVH